MSDAVTATYVFDVPTLRKSLRVHSRTRLAPRIYFVVTLTMAMLGLMFSVWIGIGYGIKDPAFKWAVLTCLYFALMNRLSYFIAAKRFKKSAHCGKERSITFSQSGLNSHSELSSSESKWAGFISATIAPEGMLLYIQSIMYFWVPSSGFASPEDFAKACDMVKANVKQVKDRR